MLNSKIVYHMGSLDIAEFRTCDIHVKCNVVCSEQQIRNILSCMNMVFRFGKRS